MSFQLVLRSMQDSDLPTLFEQQRDPVANYMAAFTAKDPDDEAAFTAHWQRIRAAAGVTIRIIEVDEQIAGSVLSYEDEGRPEVSYWLGQAFWGRGIATAALAAFLNQVDRRRPMYARVARDNIGSRRVLEKCGFVVIEEMHGFANARNAEIIEQLLKLGPAAEDKAATTKQAQR